MGGCHPWARALPCRVRRAHLMASGHPAELIAERADGLGFAHPGDSLFFVCAKKSKQKKAPPDIRPCASLRVPSFRCRSGAGLQGPSLAL
ncbi:hypothetical protein PSEUDO8AS_30195 [Pseudomonas sp. 8AS]|nr:hypothetical protein PSEUDO8AS_30195 [Pseudomonas sp. 8AS]